VGYQAVAALKHGEHVVGARVVHTNNLSVYDLDNIQIENIISCGNQVRNLALVNGKIEWTQGTVTRYPSIQVKDKTKIDNINSITVLAIYEVSGTNEYLVSNYLGNIATIDENGVIGGIGQGTVNVTVGLKDNVEISKEVGVEVINVTPKYSYSVLISGSDYLNRSQTLTYTAQVLNNGIIDNTKTVVWNISDSNKVQIVENIEGSNTIKLKGLAISGEVKLWAVISGRTEYAEKVITLRSGF
jgi:hypothetical protein